MESGAKLTQTINADGELVNIKNMNTSEMAILNNQEQTNKEVAVADIRKELFEGDNIIIDYKNSDHGLSKIEENKIEENKSKLEDITEELEDTEDKTDDFKDID